LTTKRKKGGTGADDTILAALQSGIWSIEEGEKLRVERNFAGRSAAIDFLDFQILDRIGGLLERQVPTAVLELLRERAVRIKGELEAINLCLFERLREQIAAGLQPGSFERMIRGLPGDAGAPEGRGYDLLDAFVNGLFSDRPLPEQTMALMPGMVSFHKTPVRIVLELIRLAEMGSTDVFFDIGSGLGQVVLLVNLISGARATGIEYEPAYCAYATAIASRLCLTDTGFVNADALEADYSTGTVFFLYTPFEGTMLRDMLKLLHQASRNRAIRIFTYGPCSMPVAGEPWLQCVCGLPDDPYSLCLFASGLIPGSGA
jgi:SAM-dependent methyltransferase